MKTPKKVAKNKVILEPTPVYQSQIKVFGKIYKASGASIKESIENLKIEGKAGGASVITISKGELKREKILSAMQVFRLFTASRIMKEVAMKNILALFGNL